jgi:integrase
LVEEKIDTTGKKQYVTQLRLHDLRHSCASFLLAQGQSPRVVMEILGHSGIAITMNTYTPWRGLRHG